MPLLANTRIEAEALVVAALESDDPASRRIAAEAQLNYRLSESFQRIDESREIDLNYLTCAEYQLFIDDMRAQNKFFQPDHWVTSQFAEGKALEPVLGVRPSDAETFCRWLTQRRHRYNERYRLPTSEEARQYSPPTDGIATWCRDVGEFNLSNLNGNDAEEIKRDLEQVTGLKTSSLVLLDLEPLLLEPPGNPFVAASTRMGWVYALGIVLLVSGFVTGFALNSWALVGVSSGVPLGIRCARDERPTVAALASVIGLVFVAAWFPSDDSVVVVVSMGVGGLFTWLLIAVFRDSSASRSNSLISSASISELFPQPLARKAFSDLVSREGTLPTMQTDPALVLHILKRDLSSLIDENGDNFESTVHRRTLLRSAKNVSRSQKQREYEWLKVIISRREGHLAPWEGIRLVREHI